MRLLLFNLATDADDPVLGFTTRWICALADRVEFVHVLTMRAGRYEVPGNVRVYSVGKEKGYSEPRRVVEFYKILGGILRHDLVDVCFSHMIPLFTVLAGPVLKVKGIPIITWYAHPKLTRTLKIAHRLSHRMVASVSTAYPYSHDKLIAIGQGIDTELFSPDSKILPEEPATILCVGRLSPVKDHPTLLKAASLLRQTWNKPFRVVIIGGPATPRDLSYVRSLHKQVEALDLNETVHFEPPASMELLPSWYRRCTIHVNMTPTGSGDKVVWEAMSCGRPCLVANEGFGETLGEFVDRLLFSFGNPEDLAQRLRWALSLSRREQAYIGDYLQRQVLAKHGLGRLADKLVHVFRFSGKSNPTVTATVKKEENRDRISNYYLLTRTFLYIVKCLLRETMEHFGPRLGGLLIDLGSGYSPYRPLFSNAKKYVAIDLARDRNSHVVADVQALPIASEVADSVVCTEVLEHVADADRVIEEVIRILKPGGNVLVTAPMSWNLHYEPYDFRRYTSYGLWQLLDRYGLEIMETRRIGGLFSLVGSRLVEGIATELYRRWEFLPRRLRHSLILCYSIPTSIFFMMLSRLGDNFQSSDAIGWAVLARKNTNGQVLSLSETERNKAGKYLSGVDARS
jgi:glycosyltransferase involved in cell wall biosynthesis/SAM-dependent methyltransferase